MPIHERPFWEASNNTTTNHKDGGKYRSHSKRSSSCTSSNDEEDNDDNKGHVRHSRGGLRSLFSLLCFLERILHLFFVGLRHF